MNRKLLRFSFLFTLTFLIASSGNAQQKAAPLAIRNNYTRSIPAEGPSAQGAVARTVSGIPIAPLPPSVIPPGTDSLPVASMWNEQSNARALHNIQVDPSNPNNIHAVLTAMTDNSGNDAGSLTRRCFYTFSSDAGKHWTTPVVLGKFRTGYADMVLYKRNGEWVPLIAAHTYTDASGSGIVSAVWVEKGHPGDGNFAECLGSAQNSNGVPEQLIWPCIAVNNDGTKAYMIASSYVTQTTAMDQLQFGVWDLSADTAVFEGWSAEPGANDANYGQAGMTSGGEYRIAVSQSGEIGVAWVNGQNTADGAIYFSRSSDGGKTWSDSLSIIAESPYVTQRAVVDQQSHTYYWTPSGSLDFWYQGDQPRFMYVGYYNDPNDNFYYPYSTTVYYVPDPKLEDTIEVAVDSSTGDPNSIPNALDQSGNEVQMQSLPIAWPTVAATTDPNQFAVFYQTYLQGDTEVFVDDTGTVIFAYGSILYSATVDGGNTWTSPTAFQVNSPGAAQKFDYRYPQVSSLNPHVGTNVVYHGLFSVDTAAGMVDSGHTSVTVPGFDVIGFAHATVTVGAAGVSAGSDAVSLNLDPIYPNPVGTSANIGYAVPTPAVVRLTVTDALGRTVRTLVSGNVSPGPHSIVFNTGDLSNGVYRYTLEADGQSVSKSMTIMR